MDEFTVKYLKQAYFEEGEFKILPSESFSEIDLDWKDEENLDKTKE